jgi:outer membrane protein assembly factor BamB
MVNVMTRVPAGHTNNRTAVGVAAFVGLALLCAFLAGGISPAAADATQPPHYLFKVDPARTGFLPEGPQPPLELRWKFQTREDRMKIEAYPSVDDGLSAATVHDGVVYVGGHDGWIYAIDAEKGKKIWDFRTKGHVMTTPTLHDGVLFAGSMDGFFYAINADDGTLAWKFESGYKLWNRLQYGGVRCSPIILEGKIIFGG